MARSPAIAPGLFMLGKTVREVVTMATQKTQIWASAPSYFAVRQQGQMSQTFWSVETRRQSFGHTMLSFPMLV
jgi:hypothetical protein